MNRFKSFSEDLKGMFSTPQGPASIKPSTNPRRVWIAVLFLGLTLIGGVLFGILAGKSTSYNEKIEDREAHIDGTESASVSGPLVIQFSGLPNSHSGAKGNNSAQGTIIRSRLLNQIETFDSVPVFAQISDYSLGQKYYGWTLIGDASSDSNVNRIKMSFRAIKSPNNSYSAEIKAQALSLDGTLGIKANKVEGIASRAVIATGSSGASGMGNSIHQSNDLSSFLLKALIQGIQSQISSDLDSSLNRSAALALKPGTEFLVQLTDNF
ncbi:MAG: hypothetical protein KA116_01650 [Proteobacteria bacterium]|nr:hypothetical protein [Pseudomonadota bacterium]